MKIVLVNKFHYLKGGSETYYFTLAKAFIQQGHQVIFFSMQDKKNTPCSQEKYFVKNQDYNNGDKIKALKSLFTIIYSKEAKKNISQLIKDEKPDLAILNLVHRQITLSIIEPLKKAGIPIFWTVHDLIFVCPDYLMLNPAGEICERCLHGDFRQCVKQKCVKNSFLKSLIAYKEAKFIKRKHYYDMVDAFICPSKFYKEKLEESKFTHSPIYYLPNPLSDNTDYHLPKTIKDYVLYFGRLSKEKGVLTLIKAIEQCQPKRKLLIIGTGPYESELKQYVLDHHLSDFIKFLGFKVGDELTKYIEEAKCVVLPSEWYENGPYSAMEAMAKGKILIVSNIGGLPELVQEGKSGFVFKTGSYFELKAKIEIVFKLSEVQLNTMGLESVKLAQKVFNSSDYCSQILKLLVKTNREDKK